MAAKDGASFAETPGWRMGLLFLLLLAFVMVWDGVLYITKAYLRARRKLGLRSVVTALEREVAVLGVVSLFLAVIEEYLIRICVDCNGACAGEASEGGGRRRALLAAADSDGGGGGLTWGEQQCGEGREPFWSAAAIYQTHILLFLLGATHIVYTGACLVLTTWRMRRWRRFEVIEREEGGEVQLTGSALHRPGSSWASHTARAFVLQFARTVDAGTYAAHRRLFLSRFGLPRSFDFQGFVVDSMEEQYSLIVRTDALLILLAALYVTLPPESFVYIWLPGLALSLSLVCGTKLASVAMQMADMAFTQERAGLQRQASLRARPVPWDRDKRLQRWQRDSVIPLASSGLRDGDSAADEAAAASALRLGRLSAPAVLQHRLPPLPPTGIAATDAAADADALAPHAAIDIDVDVDVSGSGSSDGGRSAAGKGRRGRWASRLSAAARRWLPGWLRENPQAPNALARYFGGSSIDSSRLFWLGRPQLLLRAYQLVYFANAQSIAMLLLSLWQDLDFGYEGHGDWLLPFWIALAAVVLLHSSLFILPIYALCSCVGSHAPATLVQTAIKRGIQPDMARELQRLSMLPPGGLAEGNASADVSLPSQPPPPPAATSPQPIPAAAPVLAPPVVPRGLQRL